MDPLPAPPTSLEEGEIAEPLDAKTAPEAAALPVSNAPGDTEAAPPPASFYADELNLLREEEYRRGLEHAEGEDFSDLDDLEFWQEQGVDLKGRRIVRLVGRFVPVQALELGRLRRYLYRKMHERVAAAEDYVVLYVHTGVSGGDNSPGLAWLRATYELLPLVCKARLRAVYALHPALGMRLALWGVGSWLSEGLYGKITFVSRVEFLWDYMRSSEVALPGFVGDHDAELETRPLMDYGFEVDPVSLSQSLPSSVAGTRFPFI